jgi:hypothetical protein
VPLRVRLLDPMAARALGATGRSALLVRSDGTPVGVLPAGADPVPSLRAAVAAVGGYATSLTLPRPRTPSAAAA